MSYGIGYAGAESDYNDADAVIFGIPYDHTACFKAGAREAPWTIRRASYNFEEIHFEHGVDQPVLNVYDYGNCDDFVLPEDMFAEVDFAVGPAIRDGKFPITMGGEHSVNIPIIGMGGIFTGEDAVEFLLAGASAVAVGTAIFADPMSPVKVLHGIEEYLTRHHYTSVNDIIGKVLV